MIGQAKYYLGGYETASIPTQDMYSYERKISGTAYYNDTNPNNWIGKMGLMYVSDYGYASSNCENKKIYDNNSSSNDIRACNGTNWLYNIKVNEWLLPQFASRSSSAFYVNSVGDVGNNNVSNSQNGVRPVLYLISSAQITGGNGTIGLSLIHI